CIVSAGADTAAAHNAAHRRECRASAVAGIAVQRGLPGTATHADGAGIVASRLAAAGELCAGFGHLWFHAYLHFGPVRGCGWRVQLFCRFLECRWRGHPAFPRLVCANTLGHSAGSSGSAGAESKTYTDAAADRYRFCCAVTDGVAWHHRI